jgi:hypothetical protein
VTLDNLSAFQAFPNRGADFKLKIRPNNRIDLIGSVVTVVRGKIDL